MLPVLDWFAPICPSTAVVENSFTGYKCDLTQRRKSMKSANLLMLAFLRDNARFWVDPAQIVEMFS